MIYGIHILLKMFSQNNSLTVVKDKGKTFHYQMQYKKTSYITQGLH